MHRDDAVERAKALDARVLALRPLLAMDNLGGGLRKALLKASDDRAIVNPPQDVLRLLKCTNDRTAIVVNGASEHDPFVRASDTAKFNFGITIALGPGGSIEVVAYRFHVTYASGCSPPYVRMDLARVAHQDPLREVRAHVHPGADDLRIPMPLMHPMELLDFVIYGGPADCPRTLEQPSGDGSDP